MNTQTRANAARIDAGAPIYDQLIVELDPSFPLPEPWFSGWWDHIGLGEVAQKIRVLETRRLIDGGSR